MVSHLFLLVLVASLLNSEVAGAISPRCGVDWATANADCKGIPCTTDAGCPSGQRCYGALSLSCDSIPSTSKLLRCGTTWQDANSRCGTACPLGTDVACPTGEHCFRDLATSPCGSTPPTTAPPTTTPSTAPRLRCGISWEDANAKCGTPCPLRTDASCPSGQKCWADLATSPCDTLKPPTVQPPPVQPPTVQPPTVQPPTVQPPTVQPPPVQPPAVQPPPTTSGDLVGIWYWTWSSVVEPPKTTTVGIAFNGYADPGLALAESSPIYSKLPGQKVLSLGGGNGAGAWTATALNTVLSYLNTGKLNSYTGISYDVEEGDSGLGPLFAAVFRATKAAGKTCIVTISHSSPYGIADGASLMIQFFANTDIDYISPQLYTTGYEGANEYDESAGATWLQWATAKAKFVPSIVSGSMYDDAKRFFATKGITCHGYIQWAQNGYTGIPPPPGVAPPPIQSYAPRCGKSWLDANSRCGTLCPSGTDVPCFNGERCFRDMKNSCPIPATTGSTIGKGGTRCGTTWLDANSRCGTTCKASGPDPACPAGQSCWTDLSQGVCTSAANEATVTEETHSPNSPTSPSRVGSTIPSWAMALLALGSILVAGIIAVLVVLVRRNYDVERV